MTKRFRVSRSPVDVWLPNVVAPVGRLLLTIWYAVLLLLSTKSYDVKRSLQLCVARRVSYLFRLLNIFNTVVCFPSCPRASLLYLSRSSVFLRFLSILHALTCFPTSPRALLCFRGSFLGVSCFYHIAISWSCRTEVIRILNTSCNRSHTALLILVLKFCCQTILCSGLGLELMPLLLD